jgi:predicted DNA-binding helix-hairpin-helix protein
VTGVQTCALPIYYSAFSPIPDASSALPLRGAPLMREHRLYQADWLLRFYGFEHDEIALQDGMLSLEVDPKLAWALAHPERFPVDLNRAPREMLLRVPGLGLPSVHKLLLARRRRRLRSSDLGALGTSRAKVLAFVVLADHRPAPDAAQRWLQGWRVRRRLATSGAGAAGSPEMALPQQASLFEPSDTVGA